MKHILKLTLLVLIAIKAKLVEVSSISNVPKLNHISIWFDHSVRFREDESARAYSKQDLSAMVQLISTRFTSLVLEPAPSLDELPAETDAADRLPSKMLIPSVVAEYNSQNPGIPPLKVTPSFEFTPKSITEELGISPGKNVSSLQAALYMARAANAISPATVESILLTNFGGSASLDDHFRDITAVPRELGKEANIHVYSNSSGDYTLKPSFAVMIDLPACGGYGGKVAPTLQRLAPYVDTFVVIISKQVGPPFQWPKEPARGLKMFQTFFSECEGKLKALRPHLKVVPLFSCGLPQEEGVGSTPKCGGHGGATPEFQQCWELMDGWGRENGRNVVMYEAFDIPRKAAKVNPTQRNMSCLAGWWKLKEEAVGDTHLSKYSFVEKISLIKHEKVSTTTTTPPPPKKVEPPEEATSESVPLGSDDDDIDITLFPSPSAPTSTPPSRDVSDESTTSSSSSPPEVIDPTSAPSSNTTDANGASSEGGEEEEVLDTTRLILCVVLVISSLLVLVAAGLTVYGLVLNCKKASVKRAAVVNSYVETRYGATSAGNVFIK